MTIPFRNLFKKAPKPKAEIAPAPLPRLEKPRSERLSKTVMPNATRIVAPQDLFAIAPPSPPPCMSVPAPDKPRMVSYTPYSGPPTAPPRDLPPAVALALEPDVERVISLELSDIIDQIPAGYLKPVASFDRTRRILLKASELEKGMSTGKPSVSLPSIYQQVPEIFLRTVLPSETTPVALPFAKVLEGFQKFQVRRDQVRDTPLPQVKTPFLKVTLEDNKLFGLPEEPLQTCELPPMRVEVEAATAQSLAAAEPEATASERFIPTVAPASGIAPNLSPDQPPRETGDAATSPKRTQSAPIPFHFAPKGTGAPASERVPASSGPPVPTGLPPLIAPTRIPFKVSAPSDALRQKPKSPLEPDWSTAVADLLAGAGVNEKKSESVKIRLGLKSILQSLPAFQLNGDVKDVPDEVRIEFPFPLIQPQLATGRISVSPKVFEETLPQGYRHLFRASEPDTPVSLPLEEVLKNLPGASLRIRDDQEEQEAGANFYTPFSVKTEEDAKRLQVDSAPIAKQSMAAPETAEGTGEKLDAKSAVAQAMRLPGINACAVTFADGLSLAGNLPEEMGAEGLSAMAPSLLQRIGNYMVDTKLGDLNAITLHCAKTPITFFMHGTICLTALHSVDGLTRKSREQLGRMAQELSRVYSPAEVSHVDH